MEIIKSSWQWLVELAGEAKLVIALLSGLCIFFGWQAFSLQKDYTQLHANYTRDTKDCGHKIAEAQDVWQQKFNNYRDKIDAENKANNERVQGKLDEFYIKNQELMERALQIENAYREYRNKIKS